MIRPPPLIPPTPFSSLLHPTAPPFSRPHGHVDHLGNGPRRDRRRGGGYRLHPSLPAHRPRQIPHQTQRSTARTHSDAQTRAAVLMHACMSLRRNTPA